MSNNSTNDEHPLLRPLSPAAAQRWQKESNPFKQLDIIMSAGNDPGTHPKAIPIFASHNDIVHGCLSSPRTHKTGWLDNYARAREAAIAQGYPDTSRRYFSDDVHPVAQVADDSSDHAAESEENDDDDEDENHMDTLNVMRKVAGTDDAEKQDSPPPDSRATSSAVSEKDANGKGEEVSAQLRKAWRLVELGIQQASLDPAVSRHHLGPMSFLKKDRQGVQQDLHPYQREGVGRLEELEKEFSAWMLADEMGLGKTIQTLALLVRAKERGEVGATLLIIPSALQVQWMKEIEDFLKPDTLRILPYFDLDQIKKLGKVNFDDFDLVITSYDRVSLHWRTWQSRVVDWYWLQEGHTDEPMRPKGSRSRHARVLNDGRVETPLHTHLWQRVVLDEAHRIRNTRRSRHKSILALNSRIHGCISGTPLQNDYGDLFALFSFMRIFPLSNRGFFYHSFVRIQAGNSVAAMKLQSDLELCLAAIRYGLSVRRLKGDIFEGKPVAGVRQMEIFMPMVHLDRESQDLQDKYRQLFDKVYAREREKEIRNGASSDQEPGEILSMLQKMIMSCIHPKMPGAQYSDPNEDPMEVLGVRSAAGNSTRRPNRSQSSKARTDKDRSNRQKFQDYLGKDENFKSSKINLMLKLTKDALAKQEAHAVLEPTIYEQRRAMSYGKVIIFCSFVSGLDVAAASLRHANIKFYELNGYCSDSDRKKVINRFEELDDKGRPIDLHFQEPDDTRVFLVSLAIGAEGFNFVHASRVILLNPGWNPYVEKQAFMRVNRLGQIFPVEVWKIIGMDCIDARIFEVQMDKQQKVGGVLNDVKLRNNLERMKSWTIDTFRSLVSHFLN